MLDDILSLSLNFLVPFRNPKILERENYAVVIKYRPITGQFSFSFIYTKIFSHQLIGISFFKPTFFKGIIFISDQAEIPRHLLAYVLHVQIFLHHTIIILPLNL